MTVTAELLVFSGNPNPTFDLDDGETATLAGLVAACVAAGGTAAEQAEPAVLGYRGFRLSSDAPTEPDLDLLTVTTGSVVAVSADGLVAFPDSAGCEQQLLAAARNHGLGEILDELGLGGNV